MGTAFSLPAFTHGPWAFSSGLFSFQMGKALRLLLGPSWSWLELKMDLQHRRLGWEWWDRTAVLLRSLLSPARPAEG